ncbi:phage major capsid protein [Xanthobacter sp. YC-JY1]|uniref:phage major capsid protein n=1 Tax=Xanthobacter sp. YC-JY1 TaxID=2419844 RepID=UPI001EFFAAB9|nr:phage major capsid protein [Xanthobacter sp. YC-JY1]UJX47171.1 phage major capsid protein [Xanthobacter sp. YC-JY1]
MFHDTYAPAGVPVYKADPEDPASVVTAALDAFKGEVVTRLDKIDARLDKVEAAQGGGDAPKAEAPKAETKAFGDRLDKIEAKLNRPAGVERKADEPSIERKAFGTYLRLGTAAPVEELKALTVSSDPQGGYLAPAEMSAEFIRDLVEFSPIRTLASVRATASPSVQYPKRTGVTSAKWKGETQASEGSEPSFGQLEIVVKEVNTFVDVSNQLLADSAGAAEAEVRLALAEDFGQKEGLAFVSGDGVLQPMGLLSDAGIGSTVSGSAAALTSDGLISLMYALPAAYRGRGSWLMNGSTLATLRKLKDGQGNYLWQPSYAADVPETILGRPVVEAVDMPDVAANAFPILFGDFATAYRIVDRLALSILVNPYSRATEGVTRIHATRRVGAGVVQPKALRKLKIAAN